MGFALPFQQLLHPCTFRKIMHEFPDIWSLLLHVTREVTRLFIYLTYAFAFLFFCISA